MTLDELKDLRKMADGKLSYKVTSETSCTEASPAKKRRTTMRIERPRTVAQHLQAADLSEVNYYNVT